MSRSNPRLEDLCNRLKLTTSGFTPDLCDLLMLSRTKQVSGDEVEGSNLILDSASHISLGGAPFELTCKGLGSRRDQSMNIWSWMRQRLPALNWPKVASSLAG